MGTITEAAVHSYYHGQAWLFTRTAGGIIAAGGADAISLPEIDSLTVEITTEKVERVSKRNAVATKGFSVVRMMAAMVKIACSQHTADLLKVGLFGSKSTIAGGAISGLAFQTGIVANDIVDFPSDKVNLSAFTSIVDSAGSPATLVNGTDYEADEKAGTVKFLNVAGYTQPFKLNGTEAAGTGVGMLMARTQEKWLRVKAIDIASGTDAVRVIDIYRMQIDPFASLNLINDGNEPNKYEFGGQALLDTTKSSSATFGQFGRYRQ